MAFQFLCPQGHVLQGEQSQTGQKCKCPYCQTEFLVPAAAVTDAAPAANDQIAPPPKGPPDAFPGISVGGPRQGVAEDTVPKFGDAAPEQQSLLHIPCPNGHVLETPREMLGNDAICPFCNVQFRLRLENSEERRRQNEEQQARRDNKLATAWMNWAIAAAVVVVFGLIGLIAMVASR